MCNNGIIGDFKSIDFNLETLNLSDKNNEIIIIKINTEKYSLEEANVLYTHICEKLPAGTAVIGLPIGIEMEIQLIDDLIHQLEEIKNAYLY